MAIIENHPDISQVDDETVLWRYMDIPTFLNLITRNELVFVRSDLFEDSFEGRIPPKIFKAINEMSIRYLEEGKFKDPKYLNLAEIWEYNTRISTYINCWIISEYQHVHMWKLYSKIHGVAIKTDFKSIKSSIISNYSIFPSKVSYVDFQEHIFEEWNNTIKYFFNKRREYESEREFRFVISRPKLTEDLETDNLILDNAEIYLENKTIACEINPATLIHKIYLSPYAPTWYINFLEKILEKYNLEVSIEKDVF